MKATQELKVFDFAPDYVWVCAYTKETAKRIYMEYRAWTEEDWQAAVAHEEVCSFEELRPMTDQELNFWMVTYEDHAYLSFKDKLDDTTTECIFLDAGLDI